jgi:uncharacterized protein YutE (UPF0331/DUF86 family)
MRRAHAGGVGMMVDPVRIKSYLTEIKRNSQSLQELIDNGQLAAESVPLKAAKYILIELAEAMSNTIQHILAKEKGIPVSGYVDAIVKAHSNEVISENLFQSIKPFFDFRNSLIHRYWTIDDQRLIDNIINGRNDFDQFIVEIESYMKNR